MMNSLLNTSAWVISVVFIGTLITLWFWQSVQLNKKLKLRGMEIDLFKYENNEKKSQWIKTVDDISLAAAPKVVLVQHLAGEFDPNYYDENLIDQINKILEKHQNIRMKIIFGPKLGTKVENKGLLELRKNGKSGFFLKEESMDKWETLNFFFPLFKKYKNRISLRLSESRDARHFIAVSVSDECKFCILEEFHEPFKMSQALSIKKPSDKTWNAIKAEWEEGIKKSEEIFVNEIPKNVPFILPESEDCEVELQKC